MNLFEFFNIGTNTIIKKNMCKLVSVNENR